MHGETAEIRVKDKAPCGVPQDRLTPPSWQQNSSFLHTTKHHISETHGPGDGNWGAELCQTPASQQQAGGLFSLDLRNEKPRFDETGAMEHTEGACVLPSRVPRLTSLPAAAQGQAWKAGCRDERCG